MNFDTILAVVTIPSAFVLMLCVAVSFCEMFYDDFCDWFEERNINTGEKVSFEVSGDKIEAVHMIPGWTHNIINLSETEDLVTVMTCNEIFNPNKPDTFFEEV